MVRKRKYKVSIDTAGPTGDYTVKVYYKKNRDGKIAVKRIVRIPPSPKK